MSREERIEAMAKDICPLYKEYGSCEKCDAEIDIDDAPCIYKCMAKLFIENNYCKASEIFEEIEKVFGVDLWLGSTPWKYADYERLKKKYIGKDTNVTTNTEEGK
jgi:hypothetical protein